MTTGSFGKERNSIICTACGAANAPGSRFCERCGTRLPQGPTGSQPTRAMPAPTPPAAPEQRPTVPTEASTPAPAPTQEAAAEASPPEREEAPAPPSTPDSPTVTIELPPSRQISRDAPTQTFELPREQRAESAPPASEAPAAPPSAPASTGDQPTQVDPGWNYRSWTPPAGGAAPPAGGRNEGVEAEPPREAAPAPATPPAEVTQVIRPTAATSGTLPERASAQEESPFTAPTPGPITYPTGNAPTARQGQPYGGGGAAERQGQPYGGGAMSDRPGQPYAGGATQISGASGGGQPAGPPSSGAPPPSGYMANAGQFPAPASRSNNRTLWIILGVIGGLVLLCIIICLLIVVVAAVGSSNSTGVATSVATATRR